MSLKIIKQLKTKLVNLFHNIKIARNNDLIYITEAANWSIKNDGYYICSNLNQQQLIKCRTSFSPLSFRNKILHFGYSGLFLKPDGIRKFIHSSNKIILTWFHIAPNDPRIKYIPLLNKAVDLVHTSCQTTKNQLINFGLQETKIRVIPLGVDLELFKPASIKEKIKLKKKLGLPSNKIIIGSFQKDGIGWEAGYKPKLIKGPDVFCKLVQKISSKYPIHILLTGPARGFVKKELAMAKIPFTHHYLQEYNQIADYYKALDLYIVTSRAEGGPKAILESMASGIPLISTKVGMAADAIVDNYNANICEVEDVASLYEKTINIIENNNIRKYIIRNGISTASHFSWKKIAKGYYENLYAPYCN